MVSGDVLLNLSLSRGHFSFAIIFVVIKNLQVSGVPTKFASTGRTSKSRGLHLILVQKWGKVHYIDEEILID